MADSSLLDIDVRPEADRVTLTLSGELDMGSAPTLAACLQELDAAWRCVVLDMAGVTFMDSSGIAVMLRASRVLESESRQLELRDISGPVYRLLEMAELLDVLTPTPDEFETELAG